MGTETEVRAQMPGKILNVKKNVGDKVESEEELMIMEAMKMELPVFAPCAGTIKEVKVKAGESAAANMILFVIES